MSSLCLNKKSIRNEEKAWLINKKLKKLRVFFSKMLTRQKIESNNFQMFWKPKEENPWLMRKGLKMQKELLMKKYTS